MEFDGVALAAIQGLNQKVETRCQESEARSQKLETENAELKRELAELKALVQMLAGKVNGGGQ
jgi:predicted RNase H-like nuclease (RuvC/YqgF family)